MRESGRPTLAGRLCRTSIATALLAGAVVTGTLVPTPSNKAEATTVACGSAGTPTVNALADPNFYIDSGISPKLNATFGGYTVRAGSTAESGLRLKLSNFTGGVVSLATGQLDEITLPKLTIGEATTAYFLFKASTATTTAQTHTITLYRGATYLCERTFTYTRVAETIKALANKVDSVKSSVSASATIGDELVVTVEGRTGTLGAGPAYDPGVLSYAPNALDGFPVNAWRLERTLMTISPDGVLAATTYTDRLFLSGASGPDRPYTAQYTFRAIGSTASSTTVRPVQYIASGTQVKHTDLDGSVAGTIPPITDTSNLSITKSVAAVSPSAFSTGTQTFPPVLGAVKGGTVMYTVTVSNSGGTPGSLDRVVDTMATGITFQSGTATQAGRATTPTLEGQTLTFYGPITVPAGGSTVITYKAVIRDVEGSYANSVVGWYANAKVDGSTSVNDQSPASTTVVVAPAYGDVNARDDSTGTSSGSAKIIDVLANDDGTGLTLTIVRQPSGGTAVVGDVQVVRSGVTMTVRGITYTPASNFGGTDTFEYQITNTFTTDTATVSVAVPKTAYDQYTSADPPNTDLSFVRTNAEGLLANDTCPQATCTVSSASVVSVVTGSTTETVKVGTITLTTTSSQTLGGFTYALPKADVPTGNFVVNFTYVLRDGNGSTANGSGRIVFNDFGPDRAVTAYKTKVTVNVTANDTNCNPSPCQATVTAGQSGVDGTTTEVSNKSAIDYTPNAGFVGVDTFTYSKGNDTGTVTVLTAPPAATIDTGIGTAVSATIGTTGYISTHGLPITSPLVAKYDCTNCTYALATPPTVGAVSPTKGSVTFTNTSTGAFTYTPNAGSTGSDTFTYSLTEPTGLTVVSSVTIRIGPLAVNDTGLTVLLKNTLNFNVLTNDNCPTTCTVTVTPNTGPTSGTLTQSTGGNFSYVNNSDIGTFNFDYSVTSSQTGTLTSSARVTILVEGAQNDTATTSPGVPATINVRANDPCDLCSLGTVSRPTVGTANVNTNGTITYIPPTTFAGIATFTYTVTKGGSTTSATVTVTVNPDAKNDTYAVLPSSAGNNFDVLDNDICADCTISAKTNPAGGTLTIASDSFSLLYDAPASGGPFTFTYTITDASGGTDTATVTVTIATPPTSRNDTATTMAGTSVSIDTRPNDTCSGATCTKASVETVEIASDPSNGTASLSANPDYTVVYTPLSTFTGVDTFTYALISATGLRSTATVTVTVRPLAANDRRVTAPNVNLPINVLENDICATCTVTVTRQPTGATIVSVSGGTVTFRSAAAGTYTFDYTVTETSIVQMSADSFGIAAVNPAEASATATVVVGDATPDEGSTPLETPVNINVLDNDTCKTAGCSVTAVDVSGTPVGDSATILDAGAVDTTIRYTPATGFSGIVTFSYTVSYSGNSATADVTVLVGPATIQHLIDKNASATGNALTSLPCASCTTTFKSLTSNMTGGGDVEINSDGSYTYTPPLDKLGTATITYTITYGDSLSSPKISQDGVINVTVDSLTPSLLLTKSGVLNKGSDGIVNIGDTIAYSYRVENTYSSTLSNIDVTDDKITDDATNIDCPSGGTTNRITSLAAGAVVTCVATYPITQADIDAGKVTNVGTAAGTAFVASMNANVAASDTDTITVELTRTASTSVVKSSGGVVRANPSNSNDRAGDTITYRYVVTNTGNVTLTNVIVEDDKITDDATNLKCPTGGSSNVIASLAPAESVTCSATYTLTSTDITAGSVTNTVTVTGTAPTGATNPDPSSSAITVLLNQAVALTIDKNTNGVITDNDANGTDAGDTLVYTFLVTNTSTSATLTSISVTDTKIASGVSCTGGSGSTITSLAPSATSTCSATYTITQADMDAGVIINTGTASSNYNAGGGIVSTISGSDTNTLALTQTPTLSVTNTYSSLTDTVVSPSGRSDAGDAANFSYVVRNTGNVTLTSISVTGTSTTVVTCSGNATIASLAPGASTTCTAVYTLTQSNLDAGSATNTATASTTFTKYNAASATSVSATADATATLTKVATVAIANVGAISKGSNGRTDSGENVVFTYTVTNTGNVTFSTLAVTSSLGTVDCDPTGGTSTSIATLAPGASAECTSTKALTQALIDAGQVSDTGTVSTTYASAQVTDNKLATVNIDQSIDVAITNTFGSIDETVVDPTDRTDAGDTAGFTYVVRNDGNVTLTNVSVSSSTGTVDCGAGAQTIASLAPGTTSNCSTTTTLTLAQINAGSLTDRGTASASFTYRGDASTTTDTATADASTALGAAPALQVRTTATLSRPSSPNVPGDTINYSYKVTNTGNVTLTDIDVTVVNDPAYALDNTISASDIDCAGGTTNRIASLAPGNDATCTASYPLSQDEIDTGMVRNDVDATTGSLSGTDRVETTINQRAHLDVNHTARDLVDNSPAGFSNTDTVIYDIDVTNDGNVTLAGIVVTSPGLIVDCDAGPGVSDTITTLAPGATTSCVTSEYTITDSDISTKSVTKTATAETTFTYYGASSPTTVSHSDPATTYLASADMTLSKSGSVALGSDGVLNAGDIATYTITITNTGDIDLSAIEVTDPLIPDEDISCGGVQTNIIGSLPADDGNPSTSTHIATCTAPYTITQVNIDAGRIINIARALSGALDKTGGTTTTLTQSPALSVTNTFDSLTNTIVSPSSQTDSGDSADFIYVVRNTGNVTLTNISVTGTSTTAVTCTGGTSTIASLAPGASTTCTAAYTVTQADIDAGSAANTATTSTTFTKYGDQSATSVSATDDESTTLTKVATVSITNVGALSKGSNGRTDSGDNVVFTYTVTNTGNVALSTLNVTSSLGTVDCDPTGGTSTSIASLDPGASTECTSTKALTQTQIDVGQVSDTGTASTTFSGSSVTDNDVATVNIDQNIGVGITNDFGAITKTVVDPVNRADVGDTAGFTYVVENTGNVTLADVSVGSSTGTVDCGAGAQTIVTLAPGATSACSATTALTQTRIDAGTFTDRGTASASFTYRGGGSPTSASAFDDADATIAAAPGLEVVSSATWSQSSSPSAPGDSLGYTYTVTNTGNVTLTNVAVTVVDDTNDSTDNSVSADDIDCAGGSTNTIATLAPGAHATCSAPYTIVQAQINRGVVRNNVDARTTNASDTDRLDTPITQNADLSIDNTALPIVDNAPAGPSNTDTIVYAIRVTNTGNVTLTSIAVTTTPANLTVDCTPIASLDPGSSADCETAAYTVTDSDITVGSVTETAQAQTSFTYRASPPGTVTLTKTDPAVTYLARAAMTFEKTAQVDTGGDSRVDEGDSVAYTFTVTNTGDVNLTSITVTDQMFAPSAIDCGGSPSNVIATLPHDDADPGTSTHIVACTATHTVTQADLDAGAISNTARAVSGDLDKTSSIVTLLTQSPGLAVTNTFTSITDAVVTPNDRTDDGDEAEFAYVVRNSGNVTLTNIAVSGTATTVVDCGTGATIATLAPDDSVSCSATYAIVQADIDAGEANNTATAASAFRKRGDANATSLSVSADASGSITRNRAVSIDNSFVAFTQNVVLPGTRIDAGDLARFSYVLDNPGNTTLTNVTVASSTGTVDCDPGAGVSAIVATLAPGASRACTVSSVLSQRQIDAATVADRADATVGLTTVSDTASATIALVGKTTVAKSGALDNAVVSPADSTERGDTITYSYVVTNTGNVTLGNVTVTDDKIDDDTTIRCPSGTGANNVIASLAPGQAVTCAVTYTVTTADLDLGTVTNRASVAATLPDGSAITPSTDSVTIAVTPGLSVNDTQPGGGGSVTGVDDSLVAPMGAVLEIDVLKNDSGTTLSVVSASQPASGTTVVRNNLVVLTPPLTYVGTLQFTYMLTDGESSDSASVSVKFTENLLKPDPEIFLDMNANGRRDPKEPGIKGVSMDLQLESRATMRVSNGTTAPGASTSAQAASVTTGSVRAMAAPIARYACATVNTGFCASPRLPVGNYRVKANFTPSDYGLTTTADSDGSLDLETVSVPSGDSMTPVQFGVAGLGSVEGRVFVDRSHDDVYDAGFDKPLRNANIEIVWAGIDGIIGTEDDVVISKKTDSRGRYSLANVPVGPYTVRAASVSADTKLNQKKKTVLHNNKKSQVDFVIPTKETLPVSGTNQQGPLALAFALGISGLALMLLAARRRRA